MFSFFVTSSSVCLACGPILFDNQAVFVNDFLPQSPWHLEIAFDKRRRKCNLKTCGALSLLNKK